MDPLLIAALGGLVILWVVVKKREKSASKKTDEVPAPPRPSQLATPYHAISIRPGRRVCDAVKELQGERILSSNAPMLPLPECDIVDCGCSYVHYTDRRCGRDRRSPMPSGGLMAATGKFQVERRELDRERRKPKRDALA